MLFWRQNPLKLLTGMKDRREENQGNSQRLAWGTRCKRLWENGYWGDCCELHCCTALASNVTLGRESIILKPKHKVLKCCKM